MTWNDEDDYRAEQAKDIHLAETMGYQTRKVRGMEHNLSGEQFNSMKERHIRNALAAFDKDQASGEQA